MNVHKMRDAILGAVVADAVGVPYEFLDRGTFKATDMIGMGTHEQPVGTWSDDSSMMLCILDSINQCRAIDIIDIKKKFVEWAGGTGYMTPHGRVFDIGNTTSQALFDMPWFDKTAESTNGNGSLMRTLPLAFCHREDRDIFRSNIYKVSEITHGHMRSKLACHLYCLIAKLTYSMDFKEAYEIAIDEFVHDTETFKNAHELPNFMRIIDKSILTCPESEIKSSGYVIDTLEASLWCMYNSNSYKEAVLKAVNLGDDTDTTACVVGGLAGMQWEVPEDWTNKLVRLDMVKEILNGIAD